MNENKDLSIDEILVEADKVLQKIEEKSKKTINEIESVPEQVENDDDVKTFSSDSNSKTQKLKTIFPKILNNKKDRTAVFNLDSEEDDVKVFSEEKQKDFEQMKTFVPNSTNNPVSDKTVVSKKVVAKDKTTVVKFTKSDQKTRAIPISDKTAVVPNKERAQKRFFKSNSTDLDYNTEPPKQIVERAATIKSKSRFKKTSDLQEIPTIVAVEELNKLNTTITDSNFTERKNSDVLKNDYDISAQIKITGYDDEVDRVPTIDEDVAERLLKERREDKINKFRLFAKEEVKSDKSDAKRLMREEYKVTSSKTATMEHFFKKKKSIQVSIAFAIIFAIPLFLITILKGTPYMPEFLNSNYTYFIAVMALYSVIIVCSYSVIFHGFNLRRGINFDFPIAVTALLTMGHTVAVFLNPSLLPDNGAIYPAAATLTLLLSLFGKKTMISRVIANFEFLTNSDDKYTVEDIVNEVDAAIIARNLLVGEPLIKYSVKTDFPTSFLEISCADEPSDGISKVLGPVIIALNLGLFGIFAYFYNDITTAFNLLVAGMIISCPVISLYATNSALKSISKSLAKKGALVCGYEGAHVTQKSNAIVMRATDLFDARSCDLHGVKTFNGAKIDDAILQTAAVIMKTDSPLSSVFDDVIVGKQAILPDIDGIVYEDKLGTSAWLYQKKILVGSRDLLIKHGVDVPKEEYEKKYTKKGRKALYIAVAGKLSAMFVVSYSADPDVKKNLKKLEKSGITILLKSTDPYINEESVMEMFDLPEGFIKVMNSSNARTFDKYSSVSVEKSPAYTVYNGTLLGLISAIRGSETIVNVESVLSVLISFGSAIGFGVVALLAFVDGLNHLNPLNVIIFQSIWSIFVLIISKIRKGRI